MRKVWNYGNICILHSSDVIHSYNEFNKNSIKDTEGPIPERALSEFTSLFTPPLHLLTPKQRQMPKTYSEKLRDPRWQKRRLEVLQRDSFTCQHCGDKESTLHVHHLFYLKFLDPWDYADDALVTLCHRCHATEEEKIKAINEIIRDFTSACQTSDPILKTLRQSIID